jgi:hypothetical protein
MNSFAVSVFVFLVVFGSSMAGLLLRALVPDSN